MFPLENIRQALNLRLAITAEMQKAIGIWQNCYVGKAPWLDENVISLRLEQSITREFANITLNEMTVNISNETLSKLFETATEELNSELQSGLATGAMVIKLWAVTGYNISRQMLLCRLSLTQSTGL